MQRTLRELLDESFSVADLTTLCYDLGLVYEALGGESKPARVVALLQWAGQRGRLGDLMLAGRRLRSDLDWDDLLDAATPSGPGLPAEPRLFLSVPARPEGLVGRNQRVADIVTLLRQGATRVAVHGLPGVGKTTLAAALAYSHDILRLLPGGVLWASLGPTGSPATALAAWSIALGVPLGEASRPDDRAQRLQAVLAQRPPCLVVLDDAWRYEQVRPLLGVATPDSAFLLTTRQADLARAFSPRATLYLPELPTSEAADLLVEICPPVATADRAALEDLAGRVGGLPQALVLVAGYLNSRVASTASARREFEALRDARLWLSREDPDRHLTLAQIIDLSLDALPDAARTAYLALAAFAPKPADFSRAAALTVGQTGDRSLDQCCLHNLVETADGERLQIHQTLAERAYQRAAEDGLLLDAVLRHAEFYLSVVEQFDEAHLERGMSFADPLEWKQVTLAWDRLTEYAPHDDALAACLVAHSRHWANTVNLTYHPHRAEWLRVANETTQRIGTTEDKANTLKAQADVLAFLDQRAEALDKYEAALTLFRAVGDRLGEANTLKAQADVLAFLDQRAEALDKYEAALTLYRQAGARLGEANTLKAQADVLAFLDQRAEALDKYEAALTLFRAVGDRLGEANTLQAQADVLYFQKQTAEALDKYEAALTLYRQAGARLGEANTLKAQADVLAFLDQRAEALDKYEAALTLFRAVGDRLGEANTLQAQADVLYFQKQTAEALDKYEAALTLYRQAGARLGEANTLKAQADVLYFQKQTAEALDKYEAALTLFRAVGDRLGEANTLQAQADVLYFQKQTAEALDKYEAALTLYRQAGARLGEANTLKAQADVLYFQKQTAEALDKYEAALTLYRQAGARLGEANTLKAQADVLAFLDQRAEALDKYEAALTLYRQAGARLGEANTLKAQADVLAFLDQRAEALDKYEAALTLFRAVGDRLGEANTLQAQADVRRTSEEYPVAQSLYENALKLYQLIGARQGEANAYLGLGRLALAQAQWDAARRWTEQAIALHQANQDRYSASLDRETLAQVQVGQGDTDGAAATLRLAAEGYASIGLTDRAASALTTLGNVLDEARRHEEALAVFQHALELQPDLAFLRRNVADQLRKLGRLDAAEAELDQAERLEPDAPFLLLRRAELAQARGARAAAAGWARRALAQQHDWDDAQAVLAWASKEEWTEFTEFTN